MAKFSLKDTVKKEVTFDSGLEGKKLIVYGTNDTGKTFQLTRLDRPFLIMTESGGSAVNCPKEPCVAWSKFKEIVEDLVGDKTFEENYELARTIIIDTLENLVSQSEKAICNQHGVRDLSEITGKVNGYLLARKDFEMTINKLTSKGYCVIFIAHEETVELEDEVTGEVFNFVQPKGTSNEKSSSRMVRDLCDFCIYLKPNGIDRETFETIPSTAICKRTKNVFARSRFAVQTFIQPFTAEGLVEAIKLAVEKSASEANTRIESFKVTTDKYSKDDYVELIKPYIIRLNPICPEELVNIVEAELGEGKKITEATDDELVALDNIYNNLVTKAMMLGVEV